ncbi:MAG TPA: hypothetical protein VMZ92_12340 [Planctomycetota bacterium]|nr:hypothetical protein [Planctomycetota bacterium]
MRGLAVGVGVVVGVVVVSASCFAQAGLPRRDYGDSEMCYVLVEKAGLEVTCNIYRTKEEIKERSTAVARENAETRKANKELDAEVKKLEGQIAAKGRALAKTEDADAKTALEKEIADLKTELEEKKGEKKAFIRLIGPKRFNKRADADAYIQEVNRAAEKAKAKAEAKAEAKKD